MSKIEIVFKELSRDLAPENIESVEWIHGYFSDHKKRYASNLEDIRRYYSSGDVLEIGSFPYHMTYCLKKLGYPVTGVDLNPDRWKTFHDKHGLDIVKCDIETEEIPFEDEKFGFIVLSEVFEHLRIDPIFTLKEINRVLAPGGKLILMTPNLYSISNIVKFISGKGGANDPYKQYEKLYTKGHMGHVREYSTGEIKRFLQKTGYEIEDVSYRFYGAEIYGKNIMSIVGFVNALNPFPVLRPFQVVVSRKREN